MTKLLRYTFLFGLLLAGNSFADIEKNSATFGPYTVHYSVFNSAFVPPEVAQAHGLVRAKDRALVNISVQRTATGESVPAEVTGQAKNLIQQAKPLSFKPITEPDASYAIASLRHSNEEVFHFTVNVRPQGEARPYELKFVRTLYRE